MSRLIDAVRRDVIAQHYDLRVQMHALATRACSLRTEPDSDLGAMLREFVLAATAHLDFEERELAPRIRDLDAWGPVREASLLAEHAEQRSQLDRIFAGSYFAPREGESFEHEVLKLVTNFLRDMKDEERWLLELVEIETFGHSDQMTG